MLRSIQKESNLKKLYKLGCIKTGTTNRLSFNQEKKKEKRGGRESEIDTADQ